MLIPCCILPNKLIVIDDDKGFLASINNALTVFKYKSICFSDLEQAKNIINENKNWTDKLLNDEISRGFDDSDSTAFSIKLHLSSLKEQVYNSDRFEPITILIIDFDMPDKNGLEFIRSLNNPNIKIIMLTGKATPEIVIKAFNDREIHRYVSKGDPDYLEKINKYIKELQAEFYIDFSKIIIETLKKEHKIFNDQNFIKVFDQIIQENNIIECYLADESGSFFFQDDVAQKQIFLIVKSKQELEQLFEMAAEDQNMTAYVLKKLKHKELIPFFMTEQEQIEDASRWKLFEAQPLDDEKNFYYAIITNDEDLEMDRSRIKSYSEFLNESE